MKRFFAFILPVLIIGCARVQTLNLAPHEYSERPKFVVWVQVAGFSEEHLPLLRFNVAESSHKTSMEQVDCIGKMWNFNLYQLRPEASKSFLSQINGSKNIKGTCEDYGNVSAWSYLQSIGYEVAILESGANSAQSLEGSLGCPNNRTVDLNKVHFWKMSSDSAASQKTFHYQDSPDQMRNALLPGLYYDRSCQKGLCYSTLSNNFKTMWSQITKDHPKNFFLIRDFNFQNALKKKDISLAKEALQEIDKLIASINKDKAGEILIIVSGAESMPIEFPLQGKEWSDFEKSGKNIYYKNSSLMSPVLAFGAMSENFCGIFDESEMLRRVIYKPERKVFNSDLLNPF